MKIVRTLFRCNYGGSAAEFALVLPLALLFIFGIIDVGRFMWEYNQAEKATQTGARWAVATQMVAAELGEYNFAAIDSGILQGNAVPQADFPGVECSSDGTDVSCECIQNDACGDYLGIATADDADAGSDAFNNLLNRMNDIKSNITAENLKISYSYSGLGYAGDPNGPDVAPLVTVRLSELEFTPITTMLFGAPSLDMPDFSYSLTLEDGAGTASN